MTESLETLAADVAEMRDKDAIRDVVYRYARAMDRLDRDLLLSCYHEDAVDDHGKFLGSPEEFWEWGYDQHTRVHLTTMHNIMNHLCEVEGDVAHAETYYAFTAMCRDGVPLVMTGGRYIDRFEKRGGEWRIAYRICTRDWANLEERPDPDDLSTFTSTRHLLSEERRQFMNEGFAPRRDRSDVSYRRPLRPDPARTEAWQRLEGK